MTDQPERPLPSDLPGEAVPGRDEIRTGDGAPADASRGIFPIVRYDGDGRIHLLGTGFFVSTTGLFVTARHVLMDTFDSKGGERYANGILQFLPDNIYIPRPILRCAAHPVADVVVGVAAPMNDRSGKPLTNPIVTITSVPPDLNSRVVTFAYPNIRIGLLRMCSTLMSGQLSMTGTSSSTFPAGEIVFCFPHPVIERA